MREGARLGRSKSWNISQGGQDGADHGGRAMNVKLCHVFARCSSRTWQPQDKGLIKRGALAIPQSAQRGLTRRRGGCPKMRED